MQHSKKNPSVKIYEVARRVVLYIWKQIRNFANMKLIITRSNE